MPKWIILIGIGIVIIGVILQYAPWLINWFGRLPGDIRIQNENSFVFIPITSMILVSVLFTIISSLLRRF